MLNGPRIFYRRLTLIGFLILAILFHQSYGRRFYINLLLEHASTAMRTHSAAEGLFAKSTASELREKYARSIRKISRRGARTFFPRIISTVEFYIFCVVHALFIASHIRSTFLPLISTASRSPPAFL